MKKINKNKILLYFCMFWVFNCSISWLSFLWYTLIKKQMFLVSMENSIDIVYSAWKGLIVVFSSLSATLILFFAPVILLNWIIVYLPEQRKIKKEKKQNNKDGFVKRHTGQREEDEERERHPKFN